MAADDQVIDLASETGASGDHIGTEQTALGSQAVDATDPPTAKSPVLDVVVDDQPAGNGALAYSPAAAEAVLREPAPADSAAPALPPRSAPLDDALRPRRVRPPPRKRGALHEPAPAGRSGNGAPPPPPPRSAAVEELPALPRAPRTLRGQIDSATRTAVVGWAWDPGTPDERIRLELVEDDVTLAAAVAGIDRADLVEAGIGDGGHGFRIALSPELFSDGAHVLHLRCAATGAAMPGSPLTVAAEAPAPFRWHLDRITDALVVGWIMNPAAPARHCAVVLKEGSRIAAQAVASRFRADLLQAGIGDGCHEFSLPMPRYLLDGREHLLNVVEQESGFALTKEPVRWRSGAGTAPPALTGLGSPPTRTVSEIVAGQAGADAERLPLAARAGHEPIRLPRVPRRPSPEAAGNCRAAEQAGTRILFDISDFVYYVGHHANVSGIQRVQSSIVLAIIQDELVPYHSAIFLSFNAKTRNWIVIPTGFLLSLLQELFLPEEQRLITFPREEARYGVLPGATEFDGTGTLEVGGPSVLCLLGAAWIHQDYIYRILALKRRFSTRFVMTVYDLIPIYAPETCDQDTVRVFEDFMHRALRHVDHILAASENTASDVRRYLATLQLPEPPITVTKCGSSFAEFLPQVLGAPATLLDLPERFVLFVATIEGRKNHQLMFEIWRRMVEEGDDPPALICVGRLGWKATGFLSRLVETNYLGERVILLRDISDTDLRLLYERCLFTVCPTLYEGWGLPAGESLAVGKICVSSNRASIPEVVGECGVYMDVDSLDRSLDTVRGLIRDAGLRRELEAKIRREYVPITWRSVAERVVATCTASAEAKWQEPYPYTALPYSTEISFSQLDRDTDGTGDLVLNRIVDARAGHFKNDMLDLQSFLVGEEIRGAGSWAQPERWGTWLCHGRGELVFVLEPEPSRLYYVFLRLRVCGWLHEQPVKLLANGEMLWDGKIRPDSRDIMLQVRKRVGPNSRWRLRLAAEVEVAPEITGQIAAADGRIPTIGFERLIMVPENDLKTRLDVLSNILPTLLES